MSPDIAEKTLAPQPVATMRRTTTLDSVGAALHAILPPVWSYLEAQGVPAAGPPFVRYHAREGERVDIEAGFPVAAPLDAPEGAGEVAGSELPGGPAVAAWHVGPYDTLSETYAALEAWLAAQGRAPAGAPWEVYWTDPGAEPDPSRWRTEIVWPISPSATA